LGAADRLGRALGWFSIGLGVTELLAPRLITRALGMQGSEGLVRAYGAREIGSGLLSPRPQAQHLARLPRPQRLPAGPREGPGRRQGLQGPARHAGRSGACASQQQDPGRTGCLISIK
jgi:hypothetical protein